MPASIRKFSLLLLLLLMYNSSVFSQDTATTKGREHLLMDFGWRFAFGHPFDTKKDFDNGTGYFSYLAKAAYGDGAAARDFDDRSWRKLDLPHDWAVEQRFDKNASLSHGFKALGRNFPETSVGWYRKTFTIPASDLGRHISIAFDGVFRNSTVWINGFYLGTEPSGYNGFEYNITDYLNYDGENTIAVRVDATMEEGWFYEGAGIYRHTWLNKTAPVHVAANGTFVSTAINKQAADVNVELRLINEGPANKTVDIDQVILDATGNKVAEVRQKGVALSPFIENAIPAKLLVAAAHLWSLEDPYLYQLVTTLSDGQNTIDTYQTTFGIRTIRFDADKGFFLNGRHVKIHGTNNHQDHAGVGAALPDSLIYHRIKALKDIGCNAYRCSHNTPTPELLDACDRLGMLVIDENRLMGISSTHFDEVKRLMLRDRNHPSVISWSIGNEEWGIEGNVLGARIASTMQAFVKSIDTTRVVTAAISGGWREGISNVIDVMGANYIGQINTDEQHQKFPLQPIWGTEEGSTRATRGVYKDDNTKQLIAAYDKKPFPAFYSIEEGWKYYAARDYLAGMFIWTGFDYRGEPTPFGWPSTVCYFGMMDICGFPKDNVYYLQSWWTDRTVLHIFPHWNWQGKEGKIIPVWVYSNCDEVEVFLNNKSLGKKKMELNGHLEWQVKYAEGVLEARGYKTGKLVSREAVKTTGEPASITMSAQKNTVTAGRNDVALVTVAVNDKNNLQVPTAGNDISFSIEGPGRIIGVGNGDPTSTEPDKFLETIQVVKIENLKEKFTDDISSVKEVAADYDDAGWNPAFTDERNEQFGQSVKALVYRGNFNLPADYKAATATLFYNSIGAMQSVYINGNEIAATIKDAARTGYVLPAAVLRPGSNSIAIAATPLLKKQPWDNINMNPGIIQLKFPSAVWRRKLFNGLAQLIIQPTGEPGEIKVKATGAGLKEYVLSVICTPVAMQPSVAAVE